VRDRTVARNYAEALFESAVKHEAVIEFEAAMKTVASLLDENPDFHLLLVTPRINAEEKKKVVREVFGSRIPSQVVNFLLLTIDKRRQRMLRLISEEFAEFADAHLGRAHVDVTVARPIDEATSKDIGERLSALLGKTAIPHVRVEPKLLGGIIVRSGDTIYDGSLRRRLDQMRRQLLATPAAGAAE
jgi:F-type H+-transporting ATPase subunit delta